MNIGKLRQPIVILRQAQEADGFGQQKTSLPFSPVGRFWGEPMSATALERAVGEGSRAEATIGLRFRGYVDIRPKDRLQWGTRLLEVSGVARPDGRDIALVVTCVERLTS